MVRNDLPALIVGLCGTALFFLVAFRQVADVCQRAFQSWLAMTFILLGLWLFRLLKL